MYYLPKLFCTMKFDQYVRFKSDFTKLFSKSEILFKSYFNLLKLSDFVNKIPLMPSLAKLIKYSATEGKYTKILKMRQKIEENK